MPRTTTGLFSRRSRLATAFLVLLALVLFGTVVVLSTAKAYFSIDKSAYILPDELGTWEEIQFGSHGMPLGWATKYPWVWKLLHPKTTLPDGSPAVAAAAVGAAADPLDAPPILAQVGQDDASLTAAAIAAGAIPPLRDNTPRPADPNSPPEKIPRIIHQTWIDEVLPPKWQAVRDECAAMHPDYEYMLWTDASSRAFIQEHYPWFLSTFDSYPFNIQRADAIRYFVLHRYGGIYMDLDIGCNRRLDPLLRFEVILPVTRPVGVSNDLIFAAKGHPFTDQMIHNLITFNHRYLTHYPTVMFSTGPMFVSASYGLYVDAHGAAYPSTPSRPDAGFSGVRVLPKSLYGKNAPPAEVPDAFFKHYYGSSWHAGDAGFLIFLRDHGRFLMFLGACVVAYGACRTALPRLAFSFRKSTQQQQPRSSGRRNRHSGAWIGLPVQTAARHRRHGVQRSISQTPDTLLQTTGVAGTDAQTSPSSSPRLARSKSSTAVPGPSRVLAVAAPRPQRPLPFFELDEDGEETPEEDIDSVSPSSEEPQGFFAWAGWNSRPGSSNSGLASGAPAELSTSRWRRASGVLLLPAYALSRIGSPALGFGKERETPELRQRSPSDSWSSDSGSAGAGAGSSMMGWAAGLLSSGFKGAAEARSKTPIGDMEMGDRSREGCDDDVDDDDDDDDDDGGNSAGERTPLAGIKTLPNSSASAASSSTAPGVRRFGGALGVGAGGGGGSAWLDDGADTSGDGTPKAAAVPIASAGAGVGGGGSSGLLAPPMASGASNASYRTTPPPPYEGRPSSESTPAGDAK